MSSRTTFKSPSGVAVVIAGTVSAIASLTVLPASAVTFTGTGAGFNIPDNNATGASSTIVVPDSFSITDITVTLNSLTHTHLGDLIATLTHVDTGTTVSLFNRIGQGDDGSDFNGTYSFNDAFTRNLWSVAASGGPSFVIPSGNYFPTGAGSSTLVPMLTSLSGELSSGTWRLTISDNGSGDTGALGSWALNLQGNPSSPVSVPESTSGLGLLALGLLGAAAAFKRHLN